MPNPDDLFDRRGGREKYINAYLQPFLLHESQKTPTVKICQIKGAAKILARQSFALEDRYFRDWVGHSPEDNKLLCRHKIIAATECAVMLMPPILLANDYERLATALAKRYHAKDRQDAGLWSKPTRKINAHFAVSLGRGMINDWQTEANRSRVVEKLSRDVLLAICNEHELWLRDSLRHLDATLARFPFFPVSQMWAAVENACVGTDV
ncbi:hypothetical protein FACS1894139_17220 [Planctomycetales bacterium]|nr:hypothetical protein FACS1894108_13610 [Planctomycetales bacterium]GHT08047.1 hypothetical protein FACS1894139_17220 [Planctomycetales bacterium]